MVNDYIGEDPSDMLGKCSSACLERHDDLGTVLTDVLVAAFGLYVWRMILLVNESSTQFAYGPMSHVNTRVNDAQLLRVQAPVSSAARKSWPMDFNVFLSLHLLLATIAAVQPDGQRPTETSFLILSAFQQGLSGRHWFKIL
nr:hypothetical protein CFP56_58200 [Quercus suber]